MYFYVFLYYNAILSLHNFDYIILTNYGVVDLIKSKREIQEVKN